MAALSVALVAGAVLAYGLALRNSVPFGPGPDPFDYIQSAARLAAARSLAVPVSEPADLGVESAHAVFFVPEPFVPLPAGVSGTPSQSVLWVHVSPEGRTIEVRPRTASNDSTFERAAREFAQGVVWHPALKSGTPVSGWTQYPFPPKRP